MITELLLSDRIVKILEEFIGNNLLKKEQYNLSGGLDTVEIHTLENHSLTYSTAKIMFFYFKSPLEEDSKSYSSKTNFESFYIVKDIITSSNFDSELIILIFERDSLEIKISRFLSTEIKVNWIVFSLNEIILSKTFFKRSLLDAFNQDHTEIIPLMNYSHLSKPFRGLIQKINILSSNDMREEVLINIRKIIENSLHIWWKQKYLGHDNELRDQNGKVRSLEYRLNKVKDKGGFSPGRLHRMKNIKGVGDLSAHDMNFIASPDDVRYGINEVRPFLNEIFPP